MDVGQFRTLDPGQVISQLGCFNARTGLHVGIMVCGSRAAKRWRRQSPTPEHHATCVTGVPAGIWVNDDDSNGVEMELGIRWSGEANITLAIELSSAG